MDTVDGCAAGRGRHDSESDNTESVVVGGYSTGHHVSGRDRKFWNVG